MKRLWWMLLVFVFAAGVVHAQEIPDDLSGLYVLSAQGGGFEATEDGYQLTLTALDENVTWVLTSPLLYSGQYESLVMMLDWEAMPTLAGNATMTVGDTTILLSLSSPTYDAMSDEVSFWAEVMAIDMPEEPKGGPKPPASFDAATVFIQLDPTFEQGLMDGAAIRGADTRVDRNEQSNRPRPPTRTRSTDGG